MPNSHKKRTILVIDDSEINLNILDRLLRQDGFGVFLANSAEQGLTQARENGPDLILLDIFMPGEDGFEVLERFKKDPDLKGIPVCIFTILDEEQSRQKALSLGACGYITKPFDMKEIVAKVKKLIVNGCVLE